MYFMTFSLCIFFAIDICLARRIPSVAEEPSSGVGELPEKPNLSPNEDRRIGNFGKSKNFRNDALVDEDDDSEFFLPTNPEVPEDIPEDRIPTDHEYDQPPINPRDYDEIDRENDIGETFHGNADDSESHDDYGNRGEEHVPNLSGEADEAPEVDYTAVGDEVDEEQDSEVGKSADDEGDEYGGIPHAPGDVLFESPFFNFEQMRRYLAQLERAMEQVFRQTVEEAVLMNGTYANTTEEEVNIDGHKYKVQKSIIKTGDNNSSIFIEAVQSVADAETNRTKRSNWYSADAQTAKDSDP